RDLRAEPAGRRPARCRRSQAQGRNMTAPATPLLAVRNLTTAFRTGGSWRTVVNDLSFDLAPGQTLAIVGESGSGKSVTALSLMRLVSDVNGRVKGQVFLEG